MKQKRILLVDIQDMRARLTEFYVALMRDESWTRDQLNHSGVHLEVSQLNAEQLCNKVNELDLGREWLDAYPAVEYVGYEHPSTGDITYLACRQKYPDEVLDLQEQLSQ